MRVWATTSEDDGLESLEKVWRQIKAGALICDQKRKCVQNDTQAVDLRRQVS